MTVVASPTPTVYGGGDAELGVLAAIVTLVLITPILGTVAGVVTTVARYATGLRGGSRLSQAVFRRSPGPTPSKPFQGSSVGFELLVYTLLGILLVVGLFTVGFPVAQWLHGPLATAPGTVWYVAGFVAVVWTGAVGVLSWVDPDARTERPVLLSLAVELGIFGLVTGTVLLSLFEGWWSLSGVFRTGTTTVLASVAGLGVLSGVVRRIDAVPEPGERAYAVGVVGLGVTIAVGGLVAGELGSSGLGNVVQLVGWSGVALGLLAALGTVE